MYDGTGSVEGNSGWYLVVLGSLEGSTGQYMMVLDQYGRYWLILGGTGSGLSGTGSNMMVLGQYGLILFGTWWFWISIGR